MQAVEDQTSLRYLHKLNAHPETNMRAISQQQQGVSTTGIHSFL